jgi:hypothetical protein
MIQFNLLPDIKLAYIKAQRQRRLVVSISLLICIASVLLLALLLSVDGLQHKHLNDLKRDIDRQSKALSSEPNINTILTVQHQLASLPDLDDQKPAVERLFDYMNQVTPAQVSINDLQIDFASQNFNITGTADAISSITQYVNTLKLTTYFTSDDAKTRKPAFTNVVLTSFGLNSTGQDRSQAASYQITLSADPTIFDATEQIHLTVPTVVTRAQLPNPSDLFKSTPGDKK